jgi:RNA polymerase sigma factor (sigma-70 family)
VQNALWIMQRRVGALRVVSALASWMFRVVAREWRRMMRRAVRWVTLDDAGDVAALAVPFELRRDLAAAIDALPPDYRAVLIMHDLEERAAPETADALGITIEAVQSRLHRARDRVRERLFGRRLFRPPR